MRELISRDSFCAPEIEIFNAIREWAGQNSSVDPTPILEAVRLPLMTMPELLNVVRDTNLVTADSILDAIKLQTESRDMDLQYRGFLGKLAVHFNVPVTVCLPNILSKFFFFFFLFCLMGSHRLIIGN